MTTEARRLTESWALYESANEDVEAGRLLEASAKYWEAVEAALRPVAEKRDWDHRFPNQYRGIGGRIGDEVGDTWLVIHVFHAYSFYQNLERQWYNSDDMRMWAPDVREVLERMERHAAALA